MFLIDRWENRKGQQSGMIEVNVTESAKAHLVSILKKSDKKVLRIEFSGLG